MDSEEIDNFVRKSTILQETIAGIANGSIDENTVDLREYGILTYEQQKEDQERRAQTRKNFELEQAEREKKEREREKRQWWDGAVGIHGSPSNPTLGSEKVYDNSVEIEGVSLEGCKTKTMRERYNSDYSRWGDKVYTPDDEATKEEEEQQNRLIEKQQNEEFEKANKEWCDQVKDDMKRRELCVKEKEQRALSLRVKGNKLFRRKKYSDALAKYCEALRLDPHNIYILTNLVLVHEKMNSWEEAIEYCNRAIHVDSSSTKALYLRHKALLHLNNEQSALDDLNRCINIDPENKDFVQSVAKLSSKLQNDAVEKEVRSVIDKRFKLKLKSSIEECNSSREFESFKLEHILFTVTTEKGDPMHSLMIEKQCQIMNECISAFKTHGLGWKARDARIILSDEIDTTLFKAFVSNKLCKCKIACAYMRSSGYMSELLQQLQEVCQSYENCASKEKYDVIEIINMIVRVMEADEATRPFVTEFGIVDTLLQLFSKINKPNDIDLVVVIGQLIVGSIPNAHWETHERICSLIKKDELFLRHLLLKINMASCKDSSSLPTAVVFKMISQGADIVAFIATCNDLKGKLQSSYGHDIEGIVKCLTSSVQMPCDRNKSTLFERSQMRKSIIKALLALSTIDEARKYFIRTTNTIRILLAISTSFKSEFELTREMALITLNNISAPMNEERSHINAREDIVANGGIDIITTLSTNVSESPMVKHRSSSLLSRLVLSSSSLPSQTKLDGNMRNKIRNEFLILTSHSKWTVASDSIIAESIARTASHLLNVFIVSAGEEEQKKHHQQQQEKVACGFSSLPPSSSVIDVPVIVQLLPKPKRNSKGLIDCHSVCLPPEKAPDNTPRSFATTYIPAFHANLLKLLIHYMDVSPACHKHVLDANGIEYLVCLIANSGRSNSGYNCHQNATITKNASFALARLVKANKFAKDRCRELRGMEILTELGKAGRI